MTKYQVDINSNFNQALLQVLILLIDEKEISYELFNDYIKIETSFFSRLMKEYIYMISKLEIKCNISRKTSVDYLYESRFASYTYCQTPILYDYSFNISNLTEDEERRYIYVIVYLMLINGQYISYKTLNSILKTNVGESSFKRLMKQLKKTVGFEIIKNSNQSYVIDDNDTYNIPRFTEYVKMNSDYLLYFKAVAIKYGMNNNIYVAYLKNKIDVPYDVVSCLMEVDEELIKELRFIKTTPYKYIVSEKLEGIKGLNLKGKMRIAFDAAMQLENMSLSRLCKMMNDYINENELVDAKNRQKVIKYLNIIDKVNELKYYLKDNLVNNIKYEEIPYEL